MLNNSDVSDLPVIPQRIKYAEYYTQDALKSLTHFKLNITPWNVTGTFPVYTGRKGLTYFKILKRDLIYFTHVLQMILYFLRFALLGIIPVHVKATKYMACTRALFFRYVTRGMF